MYLIPLRTLQFTFYKSLAWCLFSHLESANVTTFQEDPERPLHLFCWIRGRRYTCRSMPNATCGVPTAVHANRVLSKPHSGGPASSSVHASRSAQCALSMLTPAYLVPRSDRIEPRFIADRSGVARRAQVASLSSPRALIQKVVNTMLQLHLQDLVECEDLEIWIVSADARGVYAGNL